MSLRVAVIRTGLANLASVLVGLRRAGAEPFATEDPKDVRDASHVELPGVGAFGAAMEHLEATGMADAVRERIAAGRPTLAICLGLQLLGESSEETPGVRGLCAVPTKIVRLPDTVRVPHFGWNDVAPAPECTLLTPGHAYFANSYCCPAVPPGWNAALTTHGVAFVAAMERGPLLACQFHPELSGDWGNALIARWLKAK